MNIKPFEKNSFRTRNLTFAISLLLVVSSAPTASLASSGIPSIGTGSGEVQLTISTASSQVTPTYKLGNSTTLNSTSAEVGDVLGFPVNPGIALRVNTSYPERVFARVGADAPSLLSNATSASVPYVTQGETFVGPANSPYPANALGGYSELVVLCFPLQIVTQLTPSIQEEQYWHCSSSFNWPAASANPPGSADLFASLSFNSAAGSYNAILNVYGSGLTQVASAPGNGQYAISALTFQGEDTPLSGMINQGPAPSVNATAVTLQGSPGSRPLSQSVDASALSTRTESRIRVCFEVQYQNTTLYQVCSATIANGTPGTGSNSNATPTPVKYSGPEFSGLSAKPVAVGASSVLEGKRLNEVSSITIGGKSATFTATATELKLDVPKDLAPGLYDLVIHSAAGKLTQINAVRVQGPRTSLSVTTVSEGRISSEQLHEHALIAGMQQPELNKARCIVNGPNLAQAKAQAERLCALVRASNKNIETTVVESRSTVKNNSVFARVIYGWN